MCAQTRMYSGWVIGVSPDIQKMTWSNFEKWVIISMILALDQPQTQLLLCLIQLRIPQIRLRPGSNSELDQNIEKDGDSNQKRRVQYLNWWSNNLIKNVIFKLQNIILQQRNWLPKIETCYYIMIWINKCRQSQTIIRTMSSKLIWNCSQAKWKEKIIISARNGISKATC